MLPKEEEEEKKAKLEEAAAVDDKVELTRAEDTDEAVVADSPETEATETASTEGVSGEAAADTAQTDANSVPEEESDAERADRLSQELEAAKDKYVRLVAEFENFKRRSTQEMQSRFKFASQGLVSSLISGLDSLERAIEQAKEEENEALREFVTGIEMAKQQFYEAFAKHHIERIEPKGELFDPNRHEAMGVIETDEVKPDHVAEVFQAGYLLHDRVIRPAMVQVAKPSKR